MARITDFSQLRYRTKKEADALSEVNHRESPLLRLPREIRNRIYDYVFGGVIIYTSRAWNKLRVIPRSIFASPPQVRDESSTLTRACRPLLVCRQIYQEARLSPFKRSLFIFEPFTLAQLKADLTNEQLCAITKVEVTANIAFMVGHSRNTVQVRSPAHHGNHTLPHMWHQAPAPEVAPSSTARLIDLDSLAGLKRVIIGGWARVQDRALQPDSIRFAWQAINTATAGRNITVVHDFTGASISPALVTLFAAVT